MTAGQTGRPDGAAAGSYGLGLQLAVVGDRSYLGHTGSVPGFVAGLFVDRARATAGVCLANAASGVHVQGLPLDLMRVLEELEPTLPDPWTPTVELPPSVRDVLGLWYWGNVAFTLSYQGDRLVGRMLSDRATWFTVGLVDQERLVGATGYFAGEELRAVHRADGTVGHLECATFIFTRSPYDPEAPIPGGPPSDGPG
jgi:D-alanyl-D-alanine carboxypeptidase